MGQVTRYRGTAGGHDIELEFDQKLRVLNRARLLVDGRELDRAKVVYGERDLTATLDDGTGIAVRLHSGMMGELTRAQVRGPDGSWTDLT